MAFDANVIQVMIASPGDVETERGAIRELINEWNYVNSVREKIVLLPVGWETHSSPDMSARPQEIINKTVLKDCDLLIGVFWTRIGSPTGAEISGTVEEIKEHMKLGKPTMLYFSNTPVSPKKLDRDQYDSLNLFKEWAMRNGLIENYDSYEEFKTKFRRQLQQTIMNNPSFGFSGVVSQGEEIHGDFVVGKPKALSYEAKILLQSAESPSTNQKITFFGTYSGTKVTAGATELFFGLDRRELSKWEAALDELIGNKFVKDTNGKGEIFDITRAGFDYLEGHAP